MCAQHELLISNCYYIIQSMSRTYQPKKRKRARTHGFLKRKRTAGGRAIISRRRKKGRKRIAL